MVARPQSDRDRIAVALDLELSGGRHGASARIELRERPWAGSRTSRCGAGSTASPCCASAARSTTWASAASSSCCSTARRCGTSTTAPCRCWSEALDRFESRAGGCRGLRALALPARPVPARRVRGEAALLAVGGGLAGRSGRGRGGP